MNKTYASVVQKLTNEILELKMKQDPEIDLDNITIPTEDQLIIRKHIAEFRVRQTKADAAFYIAICVAQGLVIVGVCVLLYMSVTGSI